MKDKKTKAERANMEMDEIFNGENQDSMHIVPILSDNTRLAMIEGQEEEENK